MSSHNYSNTAHPQNFLSDCVSKHNTDNAWTQQITQNPQQLSRKGETLHVNTETLRCDNVNIKKLQGNRGAIRRWQFHLDPVSRPRRKYLNSFHMEKGVLEPFLPRQWQFRYRLGGCREMATWMWEINHAIPWFWSGRNRNQLIKSVAVEMWISLGPSLRTLLKP